MLNICGWCSLVILSLAIICCIANDKIKGGARLLAIILDLPILYYVIVTMFIK